MKTRKPLGIGLDSLLGDPLSGQESGTAVRIKEVPIEQIRPNPDQPRQVFNEESLAAFAESVKQQGVVQPLTVRRLGDGSLQIVMGERRWRAAQIAGLATVPVIERAVTDSETVVLALIENLHREDLNPYDEAVALQRLIKDFDVSQESIASAVGKSRAAVSNSIRLLNLHQSVQKLLREGQLEEATARTLLSLPPQMQVSVAGKVIRNQLSVRQTEALVSRYKKSKGQKSRNPDVLRLEDELADALGAGVSITQRGKRGGGYLRIQYKNLDQLQGIIERIRR